MTRELPNDADRGRRAFLAGAGVVVAAGVGAGTATAQTAPLPAPQGAILPQEFGALGDGAHDDADALQRALGAALAAGRPLYIPAGTYRLGRPLVIRPARALPYARAFAAGPNISGAGPGFTQLVANFDTGAVFDLDSAVDHARGFGAVLSARIESLAIGGGGSQANGIRLRSAFNIVLENLHLIGLGGSGIEIVCTAGDNDASNMVRIERVRIEQCGQWGIDAAAGAGFNEISFLHLGHVFIQACGRAGGAGGGMRWKGQICTLDQCAFTLNRNVALLVPGGAGLAQTLELNNTAFENNFDRHLLCTGISALKGRNLQFYSNDQNKVRTAFELDGARDTVRYVDIDGVVVRATAGNAPFTAFKVSGGNAELDNIRVRNVVWENFDYPGQARFEGFLFDHVAQCCRVYVTSPAELVLAPDRAESRGNCTPLRLGGAASATGEWIAAAVVGAVAHSIPRLAPNRLHSIYLWDDRNVKRLEASTVEPVLDPLSGYLVKTGDASRLLVGRVRTDAEGRLQTDG